MEKIKIQIECMRKLDVPEQKIQNVLTKYYGRKVLINKLIECEDLFGDVGKSNIEELRFNNYKGEYNKFCDYFDRDFLECRLKKRDCINCDSYFNF
jgi:hypothetical protein